MNLVRWLLLPFLCIASWYAALLIGIVILSVAMSFCPEEEQISGMCVAPWWQPVETGIFCFSTGLSALLVVATAFFVAPAARRSVAWLAWGAGTVVAFSFALGMNGWGMFASAIATGWVTAMVLSRSRFAGPDRPD